MMTLQKVRGHAVGQPDGQDDQDRLDPALQVEPCENEKSLKLSGYPGRTLNKKRKVKVQLQVELLQSIKGK